ncbi:GMC oxidoreductase [Pseudomonas yamanorum]|uniref:GMC oxidoreductase n=1 Tax=Pseudomonas yamanorum TaxID=515393 RepID=UPI003B9DD2AF
MAKVRNESANIVIVGSGVAGSLMASLCASLDGVVILETGPSIPMADPGWWFHQVARGGGTANTPYAAYYDQAADFDATGANPWNIQGGRIFGAGGTMLHWGGWVPRFKPEDFALHTNTGQGIDWPFGYNQLEPFYNQAEQYLGASGDSSDNNPPRSQPYPYGAAPYPISAGPFIQAFRQLNIDYGHLPVARYGQANDKGGPCRTTGTCDYCPVAGRFTGDQPLALLAGNPNVSLRLGAAVTAIRMLSKQQVAGVTYTDLTSGDTVELDAQNVILCNGAFEIPKLLQASTSNFWPNGIGNDNDLVGRFVSATQFFYASGTAPNPQAFEEELGFPSLYSRTYDSPECQKCGKFFISMNYETPNIDLGLLMAQGQSISQIQAACTAPATFQLYGNLSAIPQYNNRVTCAPGTTRFGLPRTLINTPDPLFNPAAAQKYVGILENVLLKMGCSGVNSGTYPQRGDHVACTTRMANSASDGVVSPELQVFGVDNLYVVSNSVMPTLPAANPTLTLVALVMRAMGSDTALARLTKKAAPPTA